MSGLVSVCPRDTTEKAVPKLSTAYLLHLFSFRSRITVKFIPNLPLLSRVDRHLFQNMVDSLVRKRPVFTDPHTVLIETAPALIKKPAPLASPQHTFPTGPDFLSQTATVLTIRRSDLGRTAPVLMILHRLIANKFHRRPTGFTKVAAFLFVTHFKQTGLKNQ